MMTDLENHQWDEIYKRDGRVFTDLLPAFHHAVEMFSDHQCRNILDLGCGNGGHVVGFGGASFDIVGFDISSTGLGLTRAWLIEAGLEAALVCGDARHNLPFADNSIEGLFSTQVIHHALLVEIRHTIKEIWRVLNQDGLAFISVAGRTHHDTAYEEIEPGTFVPLEGDEMGLPHHIFSEDEIRVEFDKFQILEISPRYEGGVTAIWIKK